MNVKLAIPLLLPARTGGMIKIISLWYFDIKVSNSYSQYSVLNVMGWTIGLLLLPEVGISAIMSRSNHTAFPPGTRGHTYSESYFQADSSRITVSKKM
jgi:hypothetical protein